MKKSLFLSVIISILVITVMIGCKPSAKKKSQEATVEVEAFDVLKIKDQIVETIQFLPNEREVVDFLMKAQASYIVDLTVSSEKAEKLLSPSKQAFAMGMYAFDMEYANVYNRGDKAYESGELAREMIRKLGLESELFSSENYIGRIKNNVENKDSVDFLVIQAMNFVNQKLAGGNQPDIFAYSTTGINIEALFVVSQLSQLTEKNAELLVVLSQQKERINTLFSLLELMSADPNIKPIYEEMQSVVAVFNNNTSISAANLAEIAPVIEKVRNSMIQ